MLIAIEGIDGAGKNTITRHIAAALTTPVSVLGFPRYGESIHAQLAQDALYGRMGDMTESVYAMATMFALDRRGAKQRLLAAEASPELLILDRYVASNAAYSAARCGDEAVIDWVYDLEFERFGLPRPALQIYLDTDVDVAAHRAQSRADKDSARVKDEYEKDGGLQARTAAAYRTLSERNWAGRWIATTDASTIIAAVKDCIGE